MLRWCVLALGLASSTGFVAVAEAKKPAPPPPRVAAAETLPAAAPPVAPAPAPQDALGIALQQKLTAATKLRRDDGDAQDRAALAAFYATRIYAPLWISNGALNAKAAAIVAEFSKADDWGLEAKDFAVPTTERVITGLPDKQTPVFSETMKTIIFKPRWNVPESIKVVELWPSLARGGTYFSRQGLRLSQNGREVDPASLDWSSVDIRKYDISRRAEATCWAS